MAYIMMYLLFFGITYVVKHIKGEKEKKRVWQVILLYGIIIILLGFRHKAMGIDLGYYRGYGYLSSYEQIAEYSWLQILMLNNFLNYEMGYVWFNKLLSYVSADSQMLLVGCAIASIVPIAKTVYRKSNDILFSTIIYVALPIFSLLFSGLRQGIAVAICFYSIQFIELKRWKKFLLFVLGAVLFHSSAIVFLLAYPAYHLKLDKKWRLVSVGVLFVIYMLRYPLFSILSKLLTEYSQPDNNNSITLLLVFILIYCFGIVFSRQDNQLNGYMNIFYIACACQCFGGVHSLAVRVGYYFMSCLCLLLPLIIRKIDDYATYTITKCIIFICFLVYGINAISSNPFAAINEYYWFWELPIIN